MPHEYVSSVPFRAGSEGYASFRIPAVVRAADGTLLAFAEGRVDSAKDSGAIDIVLKRSTDGGRSWGRLAAVARYGDSAGGSAGAGRRGRDSGDDPAEGTAGNPAPVVLDDGRVLLVFVTSAADATEERIRRGEVGAGQGRRVWVQFSEDHGLGWDAPREITGTAKHPDWRWYATTPGHALQLSSGRVLVPANHSTPPTLSGDDGTEGRYNGGHDLLSDDGGATWRIGYVDDNPDGRINVNETTAAELTDGTVYLNTRNDSEVPEHRADARSTDGGETLTAPFGPQPNLTAPVVEASVLQLRDPDVLLFSAPSRPDTRYRMSVRASTDGGVTWREVHTVDERRAAYSDLVRADQETVGLLYETGGDSAYETITFRRIPVTDLV
ncbi:sialidase family protein [Streptomyces spirodelae]|uniref:exo-alpha-sialidase n=1 Tax=Streptomyces spirodelae TaxID=2812904 RepID=A0ABS3WNB5_9ACTN|nr:sialidase family protein [Streptomyces spirodelae]MBO8184610.1 exo-alpha-sialidase [Streptomyces spirodelae]